MVDRTSSVSSCMEALQLVDSSWHKRRAAKPAVSSDLQERRDNWKKRQERSPLGHGRQMPLPPAYLSNRSPNPRAKTRPRSIQTRCDTTRLLTRCSKVDSYGTDLDDTLQSAVTAINLQAEECASNAQWLHSGLWTVDSNDRKQKQCDTATSKSRAGRDRAIRPTIVVKASAKTTATRITTPEACGGELSVTDFTKACGDEAGGAHADDDDDTVSRHQSSM